MDQAGPTAPRYRSKWYSQICLSSKVAGIDTLFPLQETPLLLMARLLTIPSQLPSCYSKLLMMSSERQRAWTCASFGPIRRIGSNINLEQLRQGAAENRYALLVAQPRDGENTV